MSPIMRMQFTLQGLLALILLILTSAGTAGASGDKSGPSGQGDLTGEEAAILVRGIFKKKRFTVLRVNRAPVKGLWEVLLETEGGKTILYFDASKRYFLGGPIFTVEGLRNMTKESLLSYGGSNVDLSAVPLEDALVLGNPEAGKRVVVFMSPTCVPCLEMFTTMKGLAVRRDDVAFYLKMLPLNREDDSYWKSETVISRKSIELLEASLAGHNIPRPENPVPQAAENMEIAERLGIRATPTTILADGTMLEGALSPETLSNWIEGHSRGGER